MVYILGCSAQFLNLRKPTWNRFGIFHFPLDTVDLICILTIIKSSHISGEEIVYNFDTGWPQPPGRLLCVQPSQCRNFVLTVTSLYLRYRNNYSVKLFSTVKSAPKRCLGGGNTGEFWEHLKEKGGRVVNIFKGAWAPIILTENLRDYFDSCLQVGLKQTFIAIQIQNYFLQYYKAKCFEIWNM